MSTDIHFQAMVADTRSRIKNAGTAIDLESLAIKEWYLKARAYCGGYSEFDPGSLEDFRLAVLDGFEAPISDQ